MTRQANRAGRPWQRKDGRWAARAYPAGGGKPRMVYGADENEVLAKQADLETRQRLTDLPPEIGRASADLPKPKTTRITVDLAAGDYELLGRYVAELTPEFHRLTLARTVRAMIRAAPGDYKVTAAITAQLRKDQP